MVVVRGRIDEPGPATIAESAAVALPDGGLVVHDELSHFGPMEEPAQLAVEITAFIATLGT